MGLDAVQAFPKSALDDAKGLNKRPLVPPPEVIHSEAGNAAMKTPPRSPPGVAISPAKPRSGVPESSKGV